MKWGPNPSGVCFSTFQLKQEAISFHGFPYIPANNLPLIAVKTSLLCRTIPQPIDLCFIAPILSNQMHSSSFLHFQPFLAGVPSRSPPWAAHALAPRSETFCLQRVRTPVHRQEQLATARGRAHGNPVRDLLHAQMVFDQTWRKRKRLTYFSCRRNYECEHCHKKFSRSYYLTDHLKVIHNRW